VNAGTTAPRLLLSVEEAAHALSVGRTTLYDLIARREVEAVHIGRRSLVKADSIARYVERLEVTRDARP
jgi:excisionase family DNA binding protein